jgi:hypothetical protein
MTIGLSPRLVHSSCRTGRKALGTQDCRSCLVCGMGRPSRYNEGKARQESDGCSQGRPDGPLIVGLDVAWTTIRTAILADLAPAAVGEH